MLETRAVVLKASGENAFVQVDRTGGGCELCKGKGCATGKLSKLFCSNSGQFQVVNPIQAGVGDEVVVTVSETVLLQGMGLVYLLPLLTLLAGAALGSVFAGPAESQDGYAFIGSISGLAAGLVSARWLALHLTGELYRPRIDRLWGE